MSTPQTQSKGLKLGAEKKKLLVLGGMVAVGLLLWGRLLIQQVPRTAVADNPQVAQGETNGDAPAEAGETLAAAPVKPVQRVSVELPTTLSRDLFTLDAGRYTRVPQEEPVFQPVVEKSAPQSTDDNRTRVTTPTQAVSLVLQTTILGESPRAMINGQVLKPGQKIGGYTLRRVMPRQVILEMNGVELRLEM
jgi:hypothetical protein